MWKMLLHVFLDSLKTLPILFLVYVLIEIIENKSFKNIKKDKHLASKFAPVVASAIGIIPQCGFSVVATDLFSKRKIAMGTLIAIFIATSDEAIPLLLTNPTFLKPMLFLILIKFTYAILIGFIVNAVYENIMRKKKFSYSKVRKFASLYGETSVTNYKSLENFEFQKYLTPVVVTYEDINKPNKCDFGCCGHNIEKDQSTFKKFIYHPLIHSIKIFAFIFVFNLIFHALMHFASDPINKFMSFTSIFQPFVVGLVGLIPTCAASVAITDLYMLGGINFGSMVAGLCSNAGIAIAVLFKQNPSKVENLTIVGILYFVSSILGMIINLF